MSNRNRSEDANAKNWRIQAHRAESQIADAMRQRGATSDPAETARIDTHIDSLTRVATSAHDRSREARRATQYGN